MKTYLLAVCCALVQLAHAGDLPVDETLASNAVAVVCVKLIFSHENKGEFTDYVVHTIRKFKNESTRNFADITVMAYKGRPGIPKEECTIYIQGYDIITHSFSTNNFDRFILVGGDATNGVSHVKNDVSPIR
jgi:hypothetical protein